MTTRCRGCGIDAAEFPEMAHAAENCHGPECSCYEIIGGHQMGCAFYPPAAVRLPDKETR